MVAINFISSRLKIAKVVNILRKSERIVLYHEHKTVLRSMLFVLF